MHIMHSQQPEDSALNLNRATDTDRGEEENKGKQYLWCLFSREEFGNRVEQTKSIITDNTEWQ